jgi:hypothetical protein
MTRNLKNKVDLMIKALEESGKRGSKKRVKELKEFFTWGKYESYKYEDYTPSYQKPEQRKLLSKQLFEVLPNIDFLSELKRGQYDELICKNHSMLSDFYSKDYALTQKLVSIFNPFNQVEKIIKEIEKSKTDEHGFKRESSFDSKGRGFSINIDIYDIDEKGQNGSPLAIIQTRLWNKATRNGYARILKNYFLIGRNENGVAFAHPIPSVRKWNIEKMGDGVKKAMEWIFDTKEIEKIKRNGDTCLIELENINEKKYEVVQENKLNIIDSHFVEAEKILKKDDVIIIFNGVLFHEKNQHPAQITKKYAVIKIGRRYETHDFSRATKD